MKKTLINKVVLCLIISIMILTVLQCFSYAKSENVQIIKKDENEYMIYVQNLLNEEFEFAFSNEGTSVDKSTLVFQDSAMDQMENGNHIAYVDLAIYDQYFKSGKTVFLWVKQGEDYKVEAEEIKLEEALSEEEIESFNQVTNKIKVECGEKELPAEVIDGVEVLHKIGTINITDDKTSQYSYKMVKAADNANATNLIKLAEKMNELDNKNIFEKLSVYNEFREVYNLLAPDINDKDWINVEDYVIDQPESKDGDQYLVWIKKDSTIDVQIMNCTDEYTPKYDKKEVVIKETTKSPITGDTIVLFAVAGVILALMLGVVILKIKNKSKE